MPDRNHNEVGGIAAEQLRSFVERIERLTEEKDALTADIREIFAEAKGNGFDTKIMRRVVQLRKMDFGDLHEQTALTSVYCRALGMDDPFS